MSRICSCNDLRKGLTLSIVAATLSVTLAPIGALQRRALAGECGHPLFDNPESWSVGNLPWSVAVGDLDGDLDLDLAVANFISDDISVLLEQHAICSTKGCRPRRRP